MGKNAINVMQEGNKALDEINGKLKVTIDNVLAINDAALKIGKNFFNIKTPQGLADSLNNNKNVVKQLNAELIERNRLEKALANQLVKNAQAESQVAKELAKAKFEQQQLNKANKEAAILSSKLATVYQKQSVKLTQLRNKYKDVALVQGESSKAAQNLLKQVTALDNRLKKVDANVGQFQRNVGNYGKAMKGAVGAVRSLAGALGLVGGAFLAVQVARDATKIIKDFGKQNATLSAILQVEKEEMKALTDESIRLGSTTAKTAGEVTSLQIAYARLGFSQSEILDLTEGTINGSIAMNAELASTANLTGAVVNTFDELSTTDAPRILDILSLSTAKSALNFSKLETGIPIVAGAANAAGVPFTKLVSLMGKLSDSGIDVSTSSTALRNIFIESAAQGLNYEQILEKIKGSTDKLTASNDEFGKRAAVSATVLAANIDATNELDVALNNAAGTAERMANKELDTLDGALKLLRSAWEGYILGANESGGASNKLKVIIKTLADNLDKILNTVVNLVKGFLLYKGILLATSLITRGYTVAVTALRIAKVALTGGIVGATRAMKLFNLATKSNPIGLVLGLLAGGVATWLAFRDGTKEATSQLSKFNKEAERLEGISNRFSKALNNIKEGRERANAAVLEQFEVEDRLLRNLEKQAVIEEERLIGRKLNNDELLKAKKRAQNSQDLALEHLKTLKGVERDQVQEKIQSLDVLSDKEKELISSAIVANNTLTDIVVQNDKIAKESAKDKNKELGKTKKIIEGSIIWYEKLIKAQEDERSRLATNTIEYKSYQKAIDNAKEAIKLLKGEVEKVPEVKYNEAGDGLDNTDLQKKLELGFYSWKMKKDKESNDEAVKSEKEAWTERLEIAQGFTSAISELGNAIFQGKIQQYDDEIQANNDKYAVLLDNENLSEQQRSALEAKRDRENAVIEKKKREEQRKQAIFNKAQTALQIGIQTSLGVISALAQVPKFDFGISASAIAGTIAGIGAIQLAAVLATPIPKYKDGKRQGEGKDGVALLNDGGKDELKIGKDGSMERITGRNVLAPVLKSDTIIPDADKYLSSMSDAELYENLHKHTILASMQGQSDTINAYLISKSINNQTDRMINAFKKNKPKVNVYNNINNSVGEDIKFLMSLNNTL